MEQLKQTILEYISITDRPDAINIIMHCKAPVDVVYTVLGELIEDGKIKRVNLLADGWGGRHHYVLSEALNVR